MGVSRAQSRRTASGQGKLIPCFFCVALALQAEADSPLSLQRAFPRLRAGVCSNDALHKVP